VVGKVAHQEREGERSGGRREREGKKERETLIKDL
jgi:hypothetical protein